MCRRADLPHYEIHCKNENNLPEFYVKEDKIEDIIKNKEDYLFTLGSYNLAVKLKKSGHRYGHNLENLSYEIQVARWGYENFLNGDAKIITKEKVKDFKGKLFFRPISDSKIFYSGLYSYENLLDSDYQGDLLMSSPKEINTEYRFFIVNGKIADHSSYKIGKMFNIQRKAAPEMERFVEELLSVWKPSENFVLDIAEKNGAFKIIEINNIHCARMYGCSLSKIIESVLNSKLES